MTAAVVPTWIRAATRPDPAAAGADLARGWTEKGVDGLDGWVALVDGRVVLGTRPGRAVPEPVVHAEAGEAGATPHAALAQHPVEADQYGPFAEESEDEPDDQEHGLLGAVRSRVRRRAAGMTRETQQALHQARDDERAADRYADAGDDTAATALAEWQRVRDHTAATRAERYGPDHDTALRTRCAASVTAGTSPNAPAGGSAPASSRRRP